MRAALPTFLALAFASPALAAPDMYLAWATSKWGTATTGSVVQRSVTWGEEADPDRDGIANLIEYACDTDPTGSVLNWFELLSQHINIVVDCLVKTS